MVGMRKECVYHGRSKCTVPFHSVLDEKSCQADCCPQDYHGMKPYQTTAEEAFHREVSVPSAIVSIASYETGKDEEKVNS
jgi:hypothetical protein